MVAYLINSETKYNIFFNHFCKNLGNSVCFRNGHGSKYGVQKLGYGRKKGVQKVVTEGKKGSKTWLRKQKWISNMVTETKMDLKYGHGNKMRFQIWSRKYHIVGSVHLAFQHQRLSIMCFQPPFQKKPCVDGWVSSSRSWPGALARWRMIPSGT